MLKLQKQSGVAKCSPQYEGESILVMATKSVNKTSKNHLPTAVGQPVANPSTANPYFCMEGREPQWGIPAWDIVQDHLQLINQLWYY